VSTLKIKIPVKNLCRKRCAEGINFGVKGLINWMMCWVWLASSAIGWSQHSCVDVCEYSDWLASSAIGWSQHSCVDVCEYSEVLNFINVKLEKNSKIHTMLTDYWSCTDRTWWGKGAATGRCISCLQALEYPVIQFRRDIWFNILFVLNPLQRKRRPLYLKTQSVPRCKHFLSWL
jgi:hypothetical protein